MQSRTDVDYQCADMHCMIYRKKHTASRGSNPRLSGQIICCYVLYLISNEVVTNFLVIIYIIGIYCNNNRNNNNEKWIISIFNKSSFIFIKISDDEWIAHNRLMDISWTNEWVILVLCHHSLEQNNHELQLKTCNLVYIHTVVSERSMCLFSHRISEFFI